MRISIKSKMILSNTVLVLIFILILVFSSTIIFKREFNNYIMENHKEASSKIVNEVLELFIKGEPTYEDFYNIGLKAFDSGIVLMVNKTYEKQLICMSDIFPNDSQNMIQQMEKTMKSVYPYFDGNYQEDIYVLEHEGEVFGYVTIGYYGPIYYSEFDVKFLSLFNKFIYMSGIIFFIIASVSIYFVADKISKPISFVSNKAKEIESGDYSDIIEFNSNTTEIRGLIESVNSLSTNLKNQKKIKKQMLQNYTHEVRTPLTVIRTTLEGMQDGVFEVTSERLQSIYNEIERIIGLIENVDALVETSNLNIKLNKKSFDIKIIVEKILKSFESMFENKKIIYKLELDKSEDYIFYGDEEKINSVIFNLISNACKYTDINGKVKINLTKKEDNFVIKVIDNGIGVEAVEKDLIFEHLYRIEKSRVKEVDGYGIGLSICKNIVIAHKGTIVVNSEVGAGSEFIVTLPITKNL